MYAFVTLALTASVLALPHNLQVRDGPTSTASAMVSCPGAPAIPDGAAPGDPCASGNSTAPNPSPSPPAARAVAPRRRKSKRGGFSTCQAVTLDQYKTSP